jgi:hypothetical protein
MQVAAVGEGPWDVPAWRVDAHRFRISRYFVTIRKLVETDFLSERVVIAAVDLSAIEVFLDLIDPLDEVKAALPTYSSADKQFFLELSEKYPYRLVWTQQRAAAGSSSSSRTP